MPQNLRRKILHPNLLLAIGALTAGALAAWYGGNHLRRQAASVEQQLRARYAIESFIVAAKDLVRGQRIDNAALAVRSMPRTFVPPDALQPEGAALLLGGRAAIDMRRGTPVVAAALSHEPLRTRLSGELPAGMRALTIAVDQLNSLGGHLAAGDAVDVFYSRLEGQGATLVPLQQRVHVLATGARTESGSDAGGEPEDTVEFGSVTLLLSAAEAARLVLAEQTGKLTLMLRRPADTEDIPLRALSSRDLLRVAHAPARDPDPNGRAIELLIGGQGTTSPLRAWLTPPVTGEGA